jgi:hypothetical protein
MLLFMEGSRPGAIQPEVIRAPCDAAYRNRSSVAHIGGLRVSKAGG